MKMFNKTSLKFFLGFLAIVAGSAIIAFLAIYFSPEMREARAGDDWQGQER